MTTYELQQVEHAWPTIAPFLFVPKNDQDYQQLVAMLDAIIDIVGEDEHHTLGTLMEIIGVLIERYEDEHVPEL
jgi:HTH-type transcriptional regulator / antitoxin HigA